MERPRSLKISGPIRRQFRPDVNRLEMRELLATAVSSLVVTPALLTPPNNRFVNVAVTGIVIESNKKVVPVTQFQVSDEYRRFEPGGRVVLNRLNPTTYSFKFKVVLQATRSSQDTAGRQYFVLVGVQDYQNGAGLTVPVLVPYKNLPPGHKVMSASAHMKVRSHH